LAPTALTPATEVDLLAHDATTGRSLYLRRASSPSVLAVNSGGAEQTLFSYGADEQPYGAALEGDWAVLAVGGVSDLGVHALYVNRVSGGDPVPIATRGADGTGPDADSPVLSGGIVYGQIAPTLLAADNASLFAFDLATGDPRSWPVPRARGPIVRWGDLLVWRAASSAVAFDLKTQKIADIPAPLESIGDATWISSDGRTVVWQGSAASGGWVKAYRSGWGAPHEYALPGEDLSPDLSSWGRYAVTAAAQRFWIVDIETGQYAPLTVEWGAATLSGGRLATAEMANEKGGSAGLRELDLTKVPPLPACSR
jgi:hypothetical protein